MATRTLAGGSAGRHVDLASFPGRQDARTGTSLGGEEKPRNLNGHAGAGDHRRYRCKEVNLQASDVDCHGNATAAPTARHLHRLPLERGPKTTLGSVESNRQRVGQVDRLDCIPVPILEVPASQRQHVTKRWRHGQINGHRGIALIVRSDD